MGRSRLRGDQETTLFLKGSDVNCIYIIYLVSSSHICVEFIVHWLFPLTESRFACDDILVSVSVSPRSAVIRSSSSIYHPYFRFCIRGLTQFSDLDFSNKVAYRIKWIGEQICVSIIKYSLFHRHLIIIIVHSVILFLL